MKGFCMTEQAVLCTQADWCDWEALTTYQGKPVCLYHQNELILYSDI